MSTNESVAVLGLGSMGLALARALLAAGVKTTVWNRSSGPADALTKVGASAASTPQEAVTGANLVLVCLRDHAAARQVLAAFAPEALAGRTVVNLSSSTPAEARHTAEWALAAGIEYLSGAIMVPTPMIGSPEALILYSGDRHLFERHVSCLRVLAGNADYVGEDHGRASLFDVAMLEIYFAGMTSFLHAAAMVTAQGVDTRSFLPYAQQIASLLAPTFDGLATDVDARNYPGTQDNLAMELAALEHIVDTSTELNLDSSLPSVMRDLARAAVDAGHGGNSYSRLVETVSSDLSTSVLT